MKRMLLFKVVFCFSVFLLLVSSVYARPPQDLELLYSGTTHILNVKGQHLSDDKNKHYIRKITVFINGKEALSSHNRRQVNPTGFELEIPLMAKPGDNILIKAYCSEGGVGEASLTVPAEEEPVDESVEAMDAESEDVEGNDYSGQEPAGSAYR